MIPFGAAIACHPISSQDKSRLHQWVRKVSLVYILGVLYYGRDGGVGLEIC